MMRGFNEEEPTEQSRHSAQVECECKGCKEDVVMEQSMEEPDEEKSLLEKGFGLSLIFDNNEWVQELEYSKNGGEPYFGYEI